jgi:hypothetical protein
MQIALVAVVLLAGMWFTVLKPKSADSSSSAPVAQTQTPTSQPVAPGVKGLATAVDKAKGAAATSDAANAKIQSATGGNGATASASTATAAPKHTVVKKAAATTTARPKSGTKAATAKAVAAKPAATKTSTTTKAKPATKPAADVDPSARLLAYLKQGKTLVVLFYGRGADDRAARKAVHLTAKGDPKHVVSAYVPIAKVGSYEAITTDVDVLAAPTILVISPQGKATPLTGYVDATVVRNAVAAAHTAATATKK